MNIIANEKSLNRIMFNINKSNNIPLDYPLYSNDLIIYDGIFNNKHWMLMDVISTCLIQLIYKIPKPTKNKRLGKNISIKNCNKLNIFDMTAQLPNPRQIFVRNKIRNLKYKDLIEVRKYRKTEVFDTPINLYFNDRDLIKVFPMLKKLEKIKLFKTLKELENLKLDSPNFLIKLFEDNYYQNFNFVTSSPDKFFNIKSIKINMGSDGKIYSRDYHLSFDTILGQLFIQNLRCCNVNFLKEEIYELDNFSHFLFKKIIVNNNELKYSISINNIKSILNYSGRHNKEFVIKIIKSLDKMKNMKIIENYSYSDKRIYLKNVQNRGITAQPKCAKQGYNGAKKNSI